MRLPVLRTPRLRSAAVPFAANGVLYGTWAARIPEVQARSGLTEGELGLALLFAAVGLVLSASGAGALVARFGAHRVTLGALAVFAAVVVSPGLAVGFASLSGALLLVGLASGLLDVSMNAHAADVEAASGTTILGSCHGLFSLGMMAGAGLGALAARLGLALAIHFALGGVVFAGAALVQGWRAAVPHRARAGEAGPLVALPVGPVAGLAALACFGLVIEGAMADWSAVFLRDRLAATEAVAALGVAAFSGSMAAARFASDALTERIGDARLVGLGALVAAAGLGVCILAPVAALAVAGFGVVGLGLAAVVPALFRAASKAPGRAAGQGIAAVTSTGYLGFLAGPPVIGLVTEGAGLRVAFGLLVVLAALLAVGAAPAFRRARRGAGASAPV